MLVVVDHPLLKRDLTILRDRATPHGLFRRKMNDAASILAYEALRDLPLREEPVETPLERTKGFQLAEEIVVVPVLRAGLGLVDGFVRFVPEARVGHVGMYRDERTHEPVDYYSNVPTQVSDARVFLVDPMLATGGSSSEALSHLRECGAKNLTFVCLVAAPEGIERLRTEHPDVRVVTAVVDRGLDENAFIRPGLGDAGDRFFGTG